MGVNLSGLFEKKEIELTQLSGKKVAIDAFNTLYQFLAIIRDRLTGEPLKDSKGRVTSHLSGLFYRTINLLEHGIKPVYCFDGEPPEFKKEEIERREEAKRKAEEKLKEALERGEEAITYAQATARLNEEMVEESKKLLEYMGIPWVQAKSEGEAQCAWLAKEGYVDYSASQDYDSLLFGSPKLVRNLSITGKRKLPKKEIYVEIKPEIIDLNENLSRLDISREQLIIIGILVGTDYNPNGVKGVGVKKALELVKKHKTLDRVLKFVSWDFDVDAHQIYNFFLNPPIETNVKIEWGEINEDKIMKFLVEERDFSEERIRKALEKVKEAQKKGTQKSLQSWFQ